MMINLIKNVVSILATAVVEYFFALRRAKAAKLQAEKNAKVSEEIRARPADDDDIDAGMRHPSNR